MNKKQLVEAVIAAVSRQKKQAEEGLIEARRAVAEAPGAMQSHSDTTRYQMSNVVSSLEDSVAAKQRAISTLLTFQAKVTDSETTMVQLGSLVSVTYDDNPEVQSLFILPEAGGTEIVTPEHHLLVVTPVAPLARSLFGMTAGQQKTASIGGSNRLLRVQSVR